MSDALPDYIEPGLDILFVGINPGLRSAAVGHHFAGPSNRFWKLIHEAGVVPERLTFTDDHRLPAFGCGITNIVARPTRGVQDLRPAEFEAGAATLIDKVERYAPRTVAVVGVTVWRALLGALGHPDARRRAIVPGEQPERLGNARVVVVPNPSGRNAHLTYAAMLDAYRALVSAGGRWRGGC